MNPLPRRFCTLFILLLLQGYAMAQMPVQSRSEVRRMDSLARVQVLHHQFTGSAAPFFPQQGITPRAMVGGQPTTKGQLTGKGPLPASRQSTGRIVTRATTLSQRPGAQPASVKICYDTSGRYYLQEDSMTYYVGSSILTSDGNVLISGEWSSRNAPYPTGGFLMKCSDTGTVQWARLYDSLNHKDPSYYNYYYVMELQDGSIMMAGSTNDQVTGNNDLVLTHTDNAGNIIWSKAYKSRLWTNGAGSPDYFNVKHMVQDPASGDIYLTSPHWSQGRNITRVHIADGTLAWSRFYQMYGSWSFDSPFGLVVEPNELLSFGTADGYYGGTFTSLYRINKNTGDTISTRFYTTVDPSGFNLGVLRTEPVVKLNNGHYVLPGKLFKYYRWTGDPSPYLYHAGIEEFDASGNFVKAYCLRNDIESNFSNSRLQVNSDGSGLFSMLQYISSYTANVYYIQFSNGQILHQRKRYYVQGMPNENQAVRLPDGSDLVVKLLGDTIDNINKIEFLNLHLSDTSSACLGVVDSSTFVEPYNMIPMTWGLDSMPTNDLYETRNRTISIRNDAPYFLPACRQVSHCDTLSMITPSDTVCMASPLLITARKNPDCGATMFLDYDTAMIQSYRQLNDSVYSVNFKSTGNTMLRGSIKGCNLMFDSVKVIVLASKGPVDLGPDTVLCPGNTIVLHADTGYATYQWQDASTDSVFTVSMPGTYDVKVTDGCGNKYTDAVLVSPHPTIPFDIGPDRTKCNDDTLHLNAPAGFLNYSWSTLSNGNVSSNPSVIVDPLSDTTYYIKAEKTPGCFAYDSLHVIVNHSSPIHLGNDTSFCSGDSVVLDAGAGFNSYQWNDGSTASQLVVSKVGSWWVKGTDANNCNSRDTLRVVNIWPLPVSQMDHDSLLCDGSTRVLKPGSFASYKWQNGSTAPSFTVSAIGQYQVTITDNHGCHTSDTVAITRILSLPANFLPPDTAVCVYGKLVLEPQRPFTSYLWSTGANSPSITVTKAGTYQLQVTDEHQCIGNDAIVVGSKECLVGFHMPSGFTPNHDGHNDVLRPFVGGILTEYNFTIYNRYGQIIFNSRNADRGWDGYFQGQAQETGVYVWTCVYQFEGQAKQIEKGTVLLIR